MLSVTANLRNKLFKEFPNFRFPRNSCGGCAGIWSAVVGIVVSVVLCQAPVICAQTEQETNSIFFTNFGKVNQKLK